MTTEDSIRLRKSMTPYQRLRLCYGCPFPCSLNARMSDICYLDMNIVLREAFEILIKYAKKENET